MQVLLPEAAKIGETLKRRGETIAVAESSSAGLISASLLSVPGASAYFVGSAVFYTRKSMQELVKLTDTHFAQMRGLSETTAVIVARAMRECLGSAWAVAEIGAAGPTGSRYGDAAGTSCIAVVGAKEQAIVVRTGQSDRVANMQAFAQSALNLLAQSLEQA
jgi:nicotinamide-nucleotide amidase